MDKGARSSLNQKNHPDPPVDQLFAAVLALKTPEECAAFFDDLLTRVELYSIAQRWHVARMLDRGQTYEDVASSTGASSGTISRVNRCLKFGSGGYRLILDRVGGSRP